MNTKSLNMKGSYPIWTVENGQKVKNTGNIVSEDIIFGNYAFGNKENGIFMVCYVGRSDSGLLKEINQRIDDGKANGCDYFKYSIAQNATEAYEKECQNYHDFEGDKGKLRNKIHPAKPKDNGHYKCPVERCEYHK